ncbi:unnamed protein product, partial [Dibothriocephalus latus]
MRPWKHKFGLLVVVPSSLVSNGKFNLLFDIKPAKIYFDDVIPPYDPLVVLCSEKSPANVSELVTYDTTVQSPMSESPEFSPQEPTATTDPYLTSIGFPYASQLRFFPPAAVPSY